MEAWQWINVFTGVHWCLSDRPFTAATGVRIPLGTPTFSIGWFWLRMVFPLISYKAASARS